MKIFVFAVMMVTMIALRAFAYSGDIQDVPSTRDARSEAAVVDTVQRNDTVKCPSCALLTALGGAGRRITIDLEREPTNLITPDGNRSSTNNKPGKTSL